MRPRHRNYVEKPSESLPPRKKKRRKLTKWHFEEEDWISPSTESSERQNTSQCVAVGDALQSDSSGEVKKSEFVFENTLYGELANRGEIR